MKNIVVFSIIALATGIALSAPVKSLIGANGVEYAEEARTEYTARDYIQDGLIAMWDGIENAGFGVHDPSRKYWEDIVGGVRLIPWVSSPKYFWWEDDMVCFSAHMKDGTLDIDTSEGFTVECLCYTAKKIEFALSSPSILHVLVAAEGYMSLGCLGGGATESTWTGNFGSLGRKWATLDRKKIQVMRCTGDGEAMTYTHDLLEDPIMTAADYPAGGSIALQIGWGDANVIWRVKCIRIYDRPLTDEEVEYNYWIDVERFGL